VLGKLHLAGGSAAEGVLQNVIADLRTGTEHPGGWVKMKKWRRLRIEKQTLGERGRSWAETELRGGGVGAAGRKWERRWKEMGTCGRLEATEMSVGGRAI
jgi:hypothetical protein